MIGPASIRRLAAAVLAAAFVLVLVPRAAVAAPGTCARGTVTLPNVPWPQLATPPEQIWPLSTGAGVTVAVIASGVDGPRALAGADVLPGQDLLDLPLRTGNFDCGGLGTQVAGIIVAPRRANVGFHGMAPGATILPIRLTDTTQVLANAKTGAGGSVVAAFASSVQYAVDHGANVIVIPVWTAVDDPALRAAVAQAIRRNVVVIASVGSAGINGSATPFPASYPGVLGVGAVDATGAVTSDSQQGRFVGITAPGANVYATQLYGGIVSIGGPGAATGFVGAAAALVRSRWPDLTAAQVVQRLEGTASLAPGGRPSDAYGYGILNPSAAVTATAVTPAVVPPPPAYRVPSPGAADRARTAAWFDSRRVALLAAGGGVLLIVLVVVAANALPAARRRRWRPVLAAPPAEAVEETVPVTPAPLFDDH